MIPIKWNGSSWVITTVDDNDWYNYSNGKWANVMLSDGVYKSELQANMIGKKLSKDNIGVPVKEDELGSIFTWVPRLTYRDDRVEFLKGTSVVEYLWTTESCFNLENYSVNALDLAFEGLWVGQTEFENIREIEDKTTQMSKEDNVAGLIQNEMITTIAQSEKTVIEKLQSKYSVEKNETMLQNMDPATYRQIIKIINTNKRVPVEGKHITSGNYIIIKDKYSENGIKYVVDKDGKRLEGGNKALIDSEETQYVFYLVDNIGNVKRYSMSYGSGRPYLKGFDKDITFYVTYNEAGEEESSIPIGEAAPANWYNYEEQMWANIVVRDKGNENYYTWIPRYMYTIDAENEKVNAKFVDLENTWVDENGNSKSLNNTDYILPEAFTWEDPNNPNNKIQLTGFWASKYKLRDTSTYVPEISGGMGSIRVNNVVATFGDSYTYEVSLIKEGKRIVKNDAGEWVEGTRPVEITGNYMFTDLPVGKYSVNVIIKDSNGKFVRGVANKVTVFEQIDIAPVLTGFNKDITYYVAYNDKGQEISNVPIGELEPSNWYNYDSQMWANIVVREEGNENYYTWIPRYEYKLNPTNEKADIQFITVDQTEPDEGYQIPEAFTWTNENGKEVALKGFWASKYKLRDASTTEYAIYGLGGAIQIDSSVIQNSNYTYEAYVIKNGKRIVKNSEGKWVEGTEGTTFTKAHRFTKLDEGEYIVNVIVKDSNGNHIQGISKRVTVLPKTPVNEPNMSDFNKNTTYYATYSSEGVETSSAPIGENEPNDWYDYDDDVKAKVAVRSFGKETYYEWIPRYQCDKNDSSRIVYIPTDKETPDEGYVIPSEFSGDNKAGYWKQLNSYDNRITASVIAGADKIKISDITCKTSDVTYEVSLIKDGTRIKTEQISGSSYTFTGLELGKSYAVSIIAKNQSGAIVAGYNREVTIVKIVADLTGFNKNTTFYVTYNEAGEEESSIPVGEAAPANWYNYEEQMWANIVVRDGGNENYYTWIPRYEYEINATNEKTNVRFISETQTKADKGYQIPEAFTWTNEKGEEVALKGFWASKYKLRDTTSYVPEIAGGMGSIRVNNVVATLGSSYTYELYLINNEGKRIVKSASGQYVEGTEPVKITENYTFTNVPVGTYTANVIVKDSNGKFVRGVANKVIVFEPIDITPDLTGFNENNTYYVTYNANGEETSSIPIGELEPSNWYNYDSQMWANIVVREEGNESYYTWIPRYEYKLNPTNEKADIQFITVDQTEPDEGYQIPEAFTWTNEKGEKVALRGFWASKYKLRASVSTENGIYGLGGAIQIDSSVIKNSNYTYEAYIIKDGKRIVKNSSGQYVEGTAGVKFTGTYKFTNVPEGKYIVNVIVKDSTGKHIQGISKEVTVLSKTPANKPDMSGYNVNTTYYVENTLGIESSYLPIGENEPSNWYDYDENKNATVVVRIGGKETYYEWIPRYQCDKNDSSRIVYIPTSKETPDTGYVIPNEFSGVNKAGYWKQTKSYENRITATVSGGDGKIKVSNITSTKSSLSYKIYLVKDGVKISEKTTISANTAEFSVPNGKYAVLIIQEDTTGTIAAMLKEVMAQNFIPDVTGFRVDLTYIVAYDSSGVESTTQTLESVLKSGAVIGDDKTLVSGEIDLSKVQGKWYDYSEQMWANIVVRDSGNENYYTWIPRYEYTINSGNQTVNAILIPETQTEADPGYKMPESFTWTNTAGEKVQLKGFWASKYKLRN